MKIVFHISVALLTASVFLSLGTSARAQGTITSSSRIPFHSVLEQLDQGETCSNDSGSALHKSMPEVRLGAYDHRFRSPM